jgi:hypothetical protein
LIPIQSSRTALDRTTPRTIQDPRDDMPLERRRIIFTEAEIVSAALAY